MTGLRRALRVLGVIALCVIGGRVHAPPPAHAAGETYVVNDYTTTAVSGRYAAPPASATNLNLGTTQASRQTLPFPFAYFGGTYETVWITASGYIHVPVDPSVAKTGAQGNPRYPVYDNPNPFPSNYGNICPYWDNLDTSAQGDVYMHVEGTAPNRRFVVSWVNCTLTSDNAGLTFQAQLHEGSNRIVFAYEPETVPSTWPVIDSGFSLGIDSPGLSDQRGILPTGRGEPADPANKGHPGTDYQLDPVVRTFTGTLLMDKLVSDATGIGNSLVEDVAVAGVEVELRFDPPGTDTPPVVVGTAVTGGDGSFTLTGYGLPSDGSTGTLHVITRSVGANVLGGTGEPHEFEILDDVDLSSSQTLGTVALDATTDPAATTRAPLNVLLTLNRVRAFVSPHVTETIPALDVLYDDASTTATAYTEAGATTDPTLRIASGSASNPDPWDDAVITKAYGRHVLATVAGSPGTTADTTFDGPTDLPNAFAEGFGFYLFAAAFDSSLAADGVSASVGATIDLDDPSLATSGGPTVAGWVTANLFDLVDGANEPQDRVDGSAPERPLQIVDAMTGAVDADRFYRDWGKDTPDAGGLARLTIHHGIVDDDGAEPNDDAGEPFDPGGFPFLIEDRVLNPYDEDWYVVSFDATTTAVDVELQRTEGGEVEPEDLAALTMELRSTAGALLDVAQVDATGTVLTARVSALIGPATVHVRVRHTDGRTHVPYRLQAFAPLRFDGVPIRDWTEGQDYGESLGVSGGVGALTIDVPLPSRLPVGMEVGTLADRVTGRPIERGTFSVSFRIRDSGTPLHTLQASQTLVIARPLDIDLGDYLGFPVGRSFTVVRGDVGGTAPRLFVVGDGSLPTGLEPSANVVRLFGTATASGYADVRIDGADLAGSTDEAGVRIVTCVDGTAKHAPVTLPAGNAACGYWFDALRGSSLQLVVGTARRREKRRFAPIVLGPDGRELLTGKRKQKRGSVAIKKLVTFETGRHFLIVQADDEGGETGLEGSLRVIAPKRLSGSFDDFGEGDPEQIDFGALDGATLSLTFKKDRRAGTSVRIVGLRSPTGAVVAPGALATKDVKKTVKVTHTLNESGTWQLLLAGTGDPGRVGYTLKIQQPKRAAFTAPDDDAE